MTRRIVLVLVSVTVVVLIALEVPLAVSYEDRRSSELTTELERDALAIGDLVEPHLEGVERLEVQALADAYEAERDARALIVDADGVGLADSQPTEDVGDSVGRSFASRPEIADALAGRVAVQERRSETLAATLVIVAVPVRSGDRVVGAVRVSRSRDDVDAAVRRYRLTLLAIGGVTLLVAAGLGVAVGRWATRPLEQLRVAAGRLERGELDSRAPEGTGPPEVRDLAARFNAMADRLAGLVRTSQDFAADASHQLRTPLTALRLRLDNLVAGGAAPTDGAAALEAELDRLERTIDGLLALTRLDQQAVRPTAVDLAAVATERASLWQPAAEDRRTRIEIDVPAGCWATVDPGHLEQILDNLLANAVDAAPAGTAVTVACRQALDAVELHVMDEGPGLAEADRAAALDRHWTRRAGGTGLGLAIVARLCEHNRAGVRLDEAPGGGLDAVVTLPAAAGASADPERELAGP